MYTFLLWAAFLLICYILSRWLDAHFLKQLTEKRQLLLRSGKKTLATLSYPCRGGQLTSKGYYISFSYSFYDSQGKKIKGFGRLNNDEVKTLGGWYGKGS